MRSWKVLSSFSLLLKCFGILTQSNSLHTYSVIFLVLKESNAVHLTSSNHWQQALIQRVENMQGQRTAKIRQLLSVLKPDVPLTVQIWLKTLPWQRLLHGISGSQGPLISMGFVWLCSRPLGGINCGTRASVKAKPVLLCLRASIGCCGLNKSVYATFAMATFIW